MTEGWWDAAVNLSEVRERLAQAWDEGHQVHAGCRECWDDGHGDQVNPYRALVGADEDNIVRGEE